MLFLLFLLVANTYLLKEFSKLCWFIHGSPYLEAITVESIQKHTEKCFVLVKLRDQIHKGYRPKAGDLIGRFRKVFDELTVTDGGLVMRGDRIVLPASLVCLALEKAHQGGHPGKNNLKRRLRNHFWWTEMNEGSKGQS